MENIANPEKYLARMSNSLREKLKMTEHFPQEARDVLDVGCADGTVTLALAHLFPQMKFLGIDLSKDFIDKAQGKTKGVENVKFEEIYLRELLARPERFDIIVFCSVLHEFFTYGEGMSSVMKALADAYELLRPGGVIIIRDMILTNSTKELSSNEAVVKKVRERKDLEPYLKDFEGLFGGIDKVYCLNHFLLKYLYTDNWAREGKEHYVPVTAEQYEEILSLLGMTIKYNNSYLIPYLREKWMVDFGLIESETAVFKSTKILAAQKN